MYKLLVHNHTLDDTFFVAKFLKGLKREISAPIILHKPRTVDAAVTLALLQQLDHYSRRPSHKYEPKRWHNNAGKGIVGTTPADANHHEQTKSTHSGKLTDKFESLKAQRRAKGECFKCGGKYSPGHKCPKTIALSVMEDLCTALQSSATESDSNSAESESEHSNTEEDDLTVISDCAMAGTQGKRTIRLQGFIDKQHVLILVDSGSDANFISQSLVEKLNCTVQPMTPVRVKVADGQRMISDSLVPSLQWSSGGSVFSTDVRVLDLPCYDMILGMEWLEEHPQMWLDWKRKKMRFKHNGQRITLRGIRDNTTSCPKLTSKQLKGLVKTGGVAQLIQLTVSELKQPKEYVPPVIETLVQANDAAFQEPTTLPPHRPFDHRIQLFPATTPVNRKPYRYNPTQKDEIEKQIKEMLSRGIIQPSHNLYSSPVLLVEKKDGGWRFCVDYRHVNAITVKDKYPLPIVDELLDELAGAHWFTKLDLRSGYHQIRVVLGDEYKTTFWTHHGHWEFKVMPFGLTNAPATFQAAMNDIFAPLMRKSVLVFMDDILVYSKTLEAHKEHLTEVFRLLQDNKLYIKMSKCSFAQPSLEYLGHIISASGVATDPSKIIAVRDWPIPANVKQLRGFLGLSGYYRKFIRHYGSISKPLTELLKKNIPFIWSPPAQQAFLTLKEALINAPVLALPDFSKPFSLETDASDVGIGAVLQQTGHPIAYLSKALGTKAKGFSTYEKECLAIILAVDKWKSYLQHRPFDIYTDHRSLIHLEDQHLTNGIQHKAFLKLLGLQYKVLYKMGSTNRAADALSRKVPSHGLAVVSVSQPKWLEVIVDS
jgi:hypothetical protein